ncbi:MAG: hypothetical protein HQL54_03320 [Magnetococcales bacterium]|nr:hypothetical protein [Magnetococcales bacterium]
MNHNPFISAYAFEKRFGLPRLRLTIEKAELAYAMYEPETIDWCKCIVETVCKHILKENNPDYVDDGKTDLAPLMKEALKAVDVPDPKIRSGITSIAYGIAETRNKDSVAGHGKAGDKPLISKTEIQIFASVCDNVVMVLLAHLDKKPPDIRHTTVVFDQLESLLRLGEYNRITDSSVEVTYDQDEGLLFIDGKELRPSEILYHFDRETYAARIQQAKESAADSTEDRADAIKQKIESLVYDLLLEHWYDDYNPNHFEYEDPEVWIDSFKENLEKGELTAFGSVHREMRVDVSSDEYQTKSGADEIVVHLYWMIDEENPDDFEVDSDELILEEIDWV